MPAPSRRRTISWKPAAVALLAAVFLTVACTLAAQQQPPAGLPAIRGTLLRSSGAPIAGAQVILQSLDGEDCAKLFNNKKEKSPKDAAKLSKCAHDLFTIETNEKGEFSFAGVQAGWYDVRFLWNIEPKPAQSPSADTVGDFLVIYAGHKDVTGRFDTLSQGDAFQFDAARDYSISFKY